MARFAGLFGYRTLYKSFAIECIRRCIRLAVWLSRDSAGLNYLLREPVCGELVLKPRQAAGIGLGSDYASGMNVDLQPSVVSSQFFHWVCHRPTQNGTAGRCRTP